MAAGVICDVDAVSLCNLDGSIFSPVVVSSPVTLSSFTIATVSDASEFSEVCAMKNSKPSPNQPNCENFQPSKLQLNPKTCVSLEPITCLASTLSPQAVSFSPKIGPLYPPGKDKYGREILTDEDSKMHLDYFEDLPSTAAEIAPPASPVIANTKKLGTWIVKLPDGQDFVDKLLPPPSEELSQNQEFPSSYFVDLHCKVKLGGTYNFAGARVKLKHVKINVAKFRELLGDYDDSGVLQYLEFGFPLGLAQEFELLSCTQNHTSAYEFYTSIDAFMKKEIQLGGITGPEVDNPLPCLKVSPLMTAVKKPSSRRTVFDASFGDLSINNNTPEKEYLGEQYQFTFPTVLDLADLIVRLGPGCLLWKRDLSRWFLQLPVDPGDYDKLGVIWRGLWFVFVSYVWGCRHAGYSAQRVASAILFILCNIGLVKNGIPYNCMVYIDDFGGAEVGERANEAYEALGHLLETLGIEESHKKALPPSTKMVFLGVEFDTIAMCMRIGDDKLEEVKDTIQKWFRKTVATKEELQSLQGQLMWVSKVVRFSRCFVSRIISEQKGLKAQKQKKTLSTDLRKDLLWWKTFLDVFNGVELIIPETVSCNVLGDATLSGAGAWNEVQKQFWSCKFPRAMQSPDVPIHLKEFYTVIIQVKIWGHLWAGKRVAIHCDNVAVVESISHLKPKDAEMQKCLREFLFLVTTYKFEPVMVRIPTKDNSIADFISRNHNIDDINKEFLKYGITGMKPVAISEDQFSFSADW